MKNSAAKTAIPLAIFMFAALLYGRTANYDIVWDDAMVLTASKTPLNAAGLKEIFTTPVDKLYRPLRTLCFAIENALNAGTREYHVTNTVIYALACLLFFHFVSRLTGSLKIAACAAALFAAHPLHAEVVSSISNGRADLMCAAFIFSSLYCFTHAPQAPFYGLLSPALFALAVLSKESAIVFSGLIFIISLQRGLCERREGVFEAVRKAVIFTFPFIAASIIYVIVRHSILGGVSQASGYHGGSLKNTALTSMSVAPDYAAALFFPLKQCALYTVAPLTGFTPKAALGMFLVASLIAAGTASLRRSPVVSFSLLFILLTWLPASNLIPLSTIKAARFMFLPSAGACVLAAAVLERAAKGLSRKEGARAAIVAAATGAIVCVYSVYTLSASSVWRNSATLWTDSITCAPHSPISWNNYGRTIYDPNKPAAAEAAFLKAISINPGFAQPYENLASIYGNAGRYGDALNMLIKRKTLGDSGYIDCKLSFAYKRVGDFQKAAERLNECRRKMLKGR